MKILTGLVSVHTYVHDQKICPSEQMITLLCGSEVSMQSRKIPQNSTLVISGPFLRKFPRQLNLPVLSVNIKLSGASYNIL